MQAAKRKIVPVSHQSGPLPLLQQLQEPFEHILDELDLEETDIPVAPKHRKRSKDIESLDEGQKSFDKKTLPETYNQLQQSLVLGAGVSAMSHYPNLSLGRDKYVSAHLSTMNGKSAFFFRTGYALDNNDTVIKLSEAALDNLRTHAGPFITYIEEMEKLKFRVEKEKVKITENDFPLVPSTLILETLDDGRQIVLAPFKYRDNVGGGVSIKVAGGIDNDGSLSQAKQFGISGINFIYFLNVHIPLMRVVYKAFTSMVDQITVDVGIPLNKNVGQSSWKDD